ncbi:MAG: helix-hairpin-helix domain-containing protein, partial [Nitrospirota bacterium]|nr:helix-hairpin-helix domain-containing protein [Nitrospirota bacterium]
TLSKFLFAIVILHVGEYAAKVLARNFRRLEDIYKVTPERIMSIKQMGEKIASSLSAFFNDEKNIRILESLKSLGLKINNPDFISEKKGEMPLEGLVFVITGILPKSRKEVEDLIYANGGHASSAISASTSYLVVGEEPGLKLEKAKSLGVKPISYDELLKMIEKKPGNPRLF